MDSVVYIVSEADLNPVLRLVSESRKTKIHKFPSSQNSRTNAIPIKENKLGVGLVSGFSVNV